MNDIIIEEKSKELAIREVLGGLSIKERCVVQHFCGSGKATWKSLEESYPGEYTAHFVRECMTDIKVVRAIRVIAGYGEAGVLRVSEIKQFWSKVVMDDEQRVGDRLKASELLGKTHKMFVDTVEVNAGEEFAKQLASANERLKEITVEVNDG